MSNIYLIYRGQGNDGGFGDYGGTSWDSQPVKVNGDVIWFSSEKTAKEVVKSLNEASHEEFHKLYSVHGNSYDGVFPVEYEYRLIPKIESKESSVSISTSIEDLHKKCWDYFSCGGHRPYNSEEEE